jgi:RHS repeat-associated protein
VTSVTPSGGSATTFAYDANGIRTKTVQPGGITTYFPFPGYEETVNGANTIKRSMYALAGQTIAMRVTGDPVSGNNGISYFYNDHLGSNTALRKPDGSWVATYYLPLRLRSVQAFGNYRGAAPNQTITDRDFTGQPQNRAVGLLYYQARFYVPGIGKFASADSIVPDKEHPPAYNRYSYALNNPLLHRDPSGHCVPLQCEAWRSRWGYGQSELTVTPTATSYPAPATPTAIPTFSPSPTPTAAPTATPTRPSGPLPPPTVPLFPGDVPVQHGYGFYDIGHDGKQHNAIDVVPSQYANNNAEAIGAPINALYGGYLHFNSGDAHRGYLLVGDFQITYSHVDFIVGAGNVTAGQQIGTIMDISKDNPIYRPEGAPNHLHLSISTRGSNREYFDPAFLLQPQ